MALGATIEQRVSDGSITKVIGSFIWDNSYPSGGYTIRPEIFGLTRLYAIEVPDLQDSSLIVDREPTSGKLKLYNATAQNSILYQELVRNISGTTHSCDYSSVVYGNVGSIGPVWVTNGTNPGLRTVIPATTDGTTPSSPTTSQCYANRTAGKIQFNAAEDGTTCVIGITTANGAAPMFLELQTGTDVDGLYSPVQFIAMGV